MLIIREAQMAALQADVVARFDQSLAEHLRHFAPRESQALGIYDMLAVVRMGRRRAAEFRFTSRESIRLYVELMFLLGSGFSTDPQYPWAASASATSVEVQDQRQRAGALHSNAIQYMHQVLGAKREFVLAALKRLTEHRLRDFLNGGPFPQSLIQKLRVVFPEKCAYLGNGPLRTIIHTATAAAEQYGLVAAHACRSGHDSDVFAGTPGRPRSNQSVGGKKDGSRYSVHGAFAPHRDARKQGLGGSERWVGAIHLIRLRRTPTEADPSTARFKAVRRASR